jgi:hypothetical protein
LVTSGLGQLVPNVDPVAILCYFVFLQRIDYTLSRFYFNKNPPESI